MPPYTSLIDNQIHYSPWFRVQGLVKMGVRSKSDPEVTVDIPDVTPYVLPPIDGP